MPFSCFLLIFNKKFNRQQKHSKLKFSTLLNVLYTAGCTLDHFISSLNDISTT